MIIDSTAIGMESARTYTSISRDAQYLLSGAGDAGSFADALLKGSEVSDEMTDSAQDSVKKQAEELLSPPSASDRLSDIIETMKADGAQRLSRLNEDNIRNQLRNNTLKYLLQLMYGDDWKEMYEDRELACDGTSGSSAGAAGDNAVFSISYADYHFEYESENTVFKTAGTVQTSDGRSISFNVEAAMSREFVQLTGTRITQNLPFADPLVINLDCTEAQVSDQKFFFDLDCDGTDEQISGLGGGSAFLALDVNGDGKINNGSELFGSASGDGFADLAMYDKDGNGWIDEADDVFSKLRLWSIGKDGEQKLIDLKAAGVGAICLQNAQTLFSVRQSSGATDAIIRSTGVFLFENGNAGTAQQIDLAKY